MALKRCKTSFVTNERGGRKRAVSAGDLLDESDAVVRQLPQHFEEVSATNKPGAREVPRTSAPVVEQATAEPGEKRRGPGRPPKAESKHEPKSEDKSKED